MINEKINIVNLHTCIQGEGRYAGVPMILVRFSGCNLNCMFKDSICDSSETSWFHSKDNNIFSIQDVLDMFSNNRHIKRAMITGGQPTLFKSNFVALCKELKNIGIEIHIEDNGTTYFDSVEKYIDFLSMSPKMLNSIPVLSEKHSFVTQKNIDTHIKNRVNDTSFNNWFTKAKQYQVKFVISTPQDIDECMAFVNKHDISKDNIYFMPEGSKIEQVQEKRRWVYEKALSLGVNYTERLHILVYNDKKNV